MSIRIHEAERHSINLLALSRDQLTQVDSLLRLAGYDPSSQAITSIYNAWKDIQSAIDALTDAQRQRKETT